MIRYHDESLEEAYASRARFGAEPWEVDAWASTYTAIGSGARADVSGDVKAVTGRAPESLAAFLARTASTT